jgi:hypothetical protein
MKQRRPLKYILILILTFGLGQMCIAPVSGQSGTTAAKPAPKSMIGYIKDEDLVDMCGCSFEHITRERGYTFASDAVVETAWMNIDGVDINLKRTYFRGSKRYRIGSRYTEIFEAEGVKAVLVKVVTRICKPYSPECETTGYNVTIRVTKDGRTQTVNAKGQCGCV